MSDFTSGRKIRTVGKPQPIQISKKISNNQLKKQLKQAKKQENEDLGLTNDEFESLMAENEFENKKLQKKKTFSYKIPEPNNLTTFVLDLLDKKIIGQELVDFIEKNKNSLNGLELLNGLLSKHTDISNLDWLKSENYGLGLKELFNSNTHDQIIGVLMIQNYCSRNQFPKITYKNNSTYLIRILFQLLFVFDIFEEETYWKWQDYIQETNEFTNDIKNLLSIQTTEFFNILKTVFTEEDYKNEDEKENEAGTGDGDGNENYDNPNINPNHIKPVNSNTQSSSDEESDNSNGIPEEQDFNLDDL